MIPHSDRQRFESELSDVRQHLDALESQLKIAAEEEQHEAIEHLEEHIDAVESRFRGLREFLKVIFENSPKKS